MKRYTTVSDSSENSSRMKDSDSVSVASSHRRFTGHKRINSELSEPLTSTASTSVLDESIGGSSGDPYFVFRSDLQNQLELVDEFLTDFLRIVHETVRTYTDHHQKIYIITLLCLEFGIWKLSL